MIAAPFSAYGELAVVVDDDKPLVTCCIITTSANDAVKPLHDRMPVILSPDDYETWLDVDTENAELRVLLRPCPAKAIATWRVSPKVNSPKFDEPSLAEPIPEPPQA